MNFPQQFISASTDYADFDHQVPAPYIRKKFTLDAAPRTAELLITGLGFYQVFINGTEITKSILAPYISNPDDVIYYDRYDTLPYLTRGDNVIGIILGNGMQNAYGGFVWDFDKARWRSAPHDGPAHGHDTGQRRMPYRRKRHHLPHTSLTSSGK